VPATNYKAILKVWNLGWKFLYIDDDEGNQSLVYESELVSMFELNTGMYGSV